MLIFLVVLLVSGLLNAAYLVPIVTRAFLRTSPDHPVRDEASPLMVVPITITMLLSILLGIFPDGIFHFFSLAEAIVEAVTGDLRRGPGSLTRGLAGGTP
jgi:multicomponent Na+:H+ antiporter subunit D